MDHLEHDLRDVLTNQRRALSTELVSLDAVYAGAARRRRRRTAIVASTAALALAAVAIPLSLLVLNGDRGRLPLETATSATPLQTPQHTANPAPTSPAPRATSSGPVGPAWSGARVTSVTATSTRTLIVLGALGDTGACTPPDCLRLAQSRDGGKSFTALAVPKDAVAGASGGLTPKGATDVRFGSAKDGWLYGSGLWSTHDGARSWRVVSMPGAVTRLAAANGTVWALVTVSGDNTQQLWRSPVGADSWTQVPDVTVGAQGDVALVGSGVVVLGAGPSKMWVSKDGSSFSSYANPCATAMQAELSATTSLWATCVTGNAAYVVTSADGVRWRQVNAARDGGAPPNSLALGARGPKDALLALSANQPLTDLYADGTQQPVRQPPTLGSSISYLGFTSVDVGYAIDGTYLWRTNDGGNTWTRLRIG